MKQVLDLPKDFKILLHPSKLLGRGRGAPHSLYDGLRDCNIFLENLVAVPGLTEEERQRWLAEVKVLKAFYHFWLLRMYGPIPIIEQPLCRCFARRNPSLQKFVDEVVEYIVELIDKLLRVMLCQE